MISTQTLEMIPPVFGREKTFAWYPPGYEQFSKVPYKTMAVLDDYSNFKTCEIKNQDVEEKAGKEVKPIQENEGTVLSSKLNSIRQDLTRRRINPFVVRQCYEKKCDNINQYMKIPTNWRPKYPEPNLESLGNFNVRHSCPISQEFRSSVETEEINVVHISEKTNHRNQSNDKCHYQSNTSLNAAVKPEKLSICPKKITNRRPHTAPDCLLTVDNSSKVTLDTRPNCQVSKTGKNGNNHLKNTPYEDDLVKYKWIMEIPGDPLNIKKPHIPVKQPYFRKIDDCKILPPELKVLKQNRDTFFYNTQPHQALSFDINPNFTSEKYNAMKNILRNQGKWNYASKNFSFVY